MELIENVLQFLVTLLGFCLSVSYYRRRGRQAYFLLACFYGCFALGSLYWTLYLILFSKTPQVFYVSEFGWIASIIFLRILQYTCLLYTSMLLLILPEPAYKSFLQYWLLLSAIILNEVPF